ncbi:MAG TPA: hypothetical protein DCL49_08770 [Candidatus Omnitrophica bacterium]|nr:MAG: hypothetical protein A2Y01_06585 [Omnitrophica WOR_2 bacterium GWC2_44_8]OGX55993.1 MAG: hypothetical protein A2460_03530 [Omnitrophica WOR_2 bacterium RIFOXYC2_FULL_43_9]HAH20978.1 hypothetical protein [Candidatus Omnitrophota bacterium]
MSLSQIFREKALQINPEYASIYYNRAVAYFLIKEYDKSWQDIYKAKELKGNIDPEFLNALERASGRRK